MRTFVTAVLSATILVTSSTTTISAAEQRVCTDVELSNLLGFVGRKMAIAQAKYKVNLQILKETESDYKDAIENSYFLARALMNSPTGSYMNYVRTDVAGYFGLQGLYGGDTISNFVHLPNREINRILQSEFALIPQYEGQRDKVIAQHLAHFTSDDHPLDFGAEALVAYEVMVSMQEMRVSDYATQVRLLKELEIQLSERCTARSH